MKVKIMNDLSIILSDADKAVQALPTVIGAVSQFQGELSSQQHASVVTAAADALSIAAQSAQSLGSKGLIGHNDTGNIVAGATLATEGVSLFAELEALAAKLKALVRHIL